MPNDVQLPITSELSYLDASKVSSPAGVSLELDVLSAEGQRIGSIEGVVIDAAARHVHYLSVRSSGWLGRRRYLVQADQLGRSRERRFGSSWNLRNAAVHGLDAATLRQFSDDDLLAAIFAPRPA